MKKKYLFAFFILLFVGLGLLIAFSVQSADVLVLQPKGLIAGKEKDLLILATLLMLIVVIPVFFLTFFIVWRYRASNTKAKYTPDWSHSHLFESIWWGFPFVIVIALSIVTWKACHELDPFKPLDVTTKPVPIQVVALQWKWLFIYPEHNIATVNFVQFPEKTPLNFEVTADAPMNSFWIPQLGGQIYAMPAMRTKLHLIADAPGEFTGSSANLSGKGFAGLRFTAKASSQEDFDEWVQSVKQSSPSLTLDAYNTLIEPSERNPVGYYVLKEEGLFDHIVMKYMMPEETR